MLLSSNDVSYNVFVSQRSYLSMFPALCMVMLSGRVVN